jgi:hypothetical protein
LICLFKLQSLCLGVWRWLGPPPFSQSPFPSLKQKHVSGSPQHVSLTA